MVQSGHRSKRLKTKENAKTPPLTGLFSVIYSVYIKLFTLTAVKSWIINHTYKCLEARLIHWGFLNKQEPAQLTINYQTCLYKNHYTLFLLTAQFIFSHGCSHLLRESTKITKKKKKNAGCTCRCCAWLPPDWGKNAHPQAHGCQDLWKESSHTHMLI